MWGTFRPGASLRIREPTTICPRKITPQDVANVPQTRFFYQSGCTVTAH
jgi:hypothetical protein